MTPLPIRFAHNARLFPDNWHPVLEEVRFAARAGFAGLQLPDRQAGVTEAHLGARFAEVRAALEDAELQVALEVFSEVGQPGAPGPRETLRRNLPAIRGLGIGLVHWHVHTRQPEREVPRLEDWLAAKFAAGVEVAGEVGARIGFKHNDPSNPLFASPSACRAMLERVPGLGFVCDLNHFPPGQLPEYAAFASRITMLHVSDTALPGLNQHRPVGLGSVDFRACFEGLVAGGFRGLGVLEIGGQPWSGGLGQDTDEALEASLRRLRALTDGPSA